MWTGKPLVESRGTFEARSHHIEIGSKYLLSEADEPAFDELVQRLRESEEWQYVEREVKLRLRRE